MLTNQISNRLFSTTSDRYLVVGGGFCLGFTLRSLGARLDWFS